MGEAVKVLVNGTAYDVEVVRSHPSKVLFSLSGRQYEVEIENSVLSGAAIGKNPEPRQFDNEAEPNGKSSGRAAETGKTLIRTPMPGVILEVRVKPQDRVKKGDIVVRIEAMKMENNVFSPTDGVVEKVFVVAGDEVSDEQELIQLI